MTIFHRVPVRLESRRYEIKIGWGHLMLLGSQIRRLTLGTHAVVLTNRTLVSSCGDVVCRILRKSGFPVQVVSLPDTERSKSMAVLNRLLLQLADGDGPGKRIFLVAVGGGVVGDVGGLAAGLYRRGIPLVQIPTTLLAQVDSSIGGKTGVDLPHGKNLVGLIVQPRLVFIELSFLESLPDRQFLSGLAEVLKCAVIGDPTLFGFLEKASWRNIRRSPRELAWLVWRSVRLKASIVEKDEKEIKGLRTALNFGHTLGHAVEAATGYSKAYTHGEAVAVGMCVATEIAKRLRLIPELQASRIVRLVGQVGLPTTLRGISLSAIRRAMAHDKKWGSGKNRWVLPVRVGRVVEREVPEPVVSASMQRVLGE